MVKNIEIMDMAIELNKIANSGIISEYTSVVCINAADVLTQFRSIVIGQPDAISDIQKISQLKELLNLSSG